MNNNLKDGDFQHLFMNVSRLNFKRTHTELEKIDLYRGQPPVLFALWEKDGRGRRELCEAVEAKPATVTKMIQRLEKTGFIYSEQDAKDARISRVYLTQKGTEIEGAVRDIFMKLEKELLNDFSNEEKEVLARFLISMKKNLKSNN